MADSAASTQSRTPRASSTKRRAGTVSTETENKLARAARSAQRLAQLSDVTRDDSTLDLFPDDPTRATLEAMNIDIRQGTLRGFELPDVVLAAVGAAVSTDGAAMGASEARSARRAPREKAEVAHIAVPLAGFERVEPTVNASAAKAAESAADGATNVALDASSPALAHEAQQPQQLAGAASLTPSMAAATVARSVTALRQAAEPSAEPASTGKPGAPPQRFAATFAKAATASREAAAASEEETSDSAAPASPSATQQVKAVLPEANTNPASALGTPPTQPTPRRPAVPFAAPLQDAAPSAPELDRARATAFADTVDALYGVISDQRRAATDHSRRMKWMLSIVVGALLVTVAIGIAQTLLLMRLTRETTAQQHRIEQMMQNQQAAMTSLLDAHLSTANAAAAAPAAASAVAPGQPAAASRHKAHAHVHKAKAAATH